MVQVMKLSIKKVPAVNGAIGIQTLADGRPYHEQVDSSRDWDNNGYHVIRANGEPVAIINGGIDKNGVMQLREGWDG
jgi:hypothetical protein